MVRVSVCLHVLSSPKSTVFHNKVVTARKEFPVFLWHHRTSPSPFHLGRIKLKQYFGSGYSGYVTCVPTIVQVFFCKCVCFFLAQNKFAMVEGGVRSDETRRTRRYGKPRRDFSCVLLIWDLHVNTLTWTHKIQAHAATAGCSIRAGFAYRSEIFGFRNPMEPPSTGHVLQRSRTRREGYKAGEKRKRARKIESLRDRVRMGGKVGRNCSCQRLRNVVRKYLMPFTGSIDENLAEPDLIIYRVRLLALTVYHSRSCFWIVFLVLFLLTKGGKKPSLFTWSKLVLSGCRWLGMGRLASPTAHSVPTHTHTSRFMKV